MWMYPLAIWAEEKHLEKVGRVRRKGRSGALCLPTYHSVCMKDSWVSCGSEYGWWRRAFLPFNRGRLRARRPQLQENNDCTLVVSEERIKELWRGQAGVKSSTTFYIMGSSAEGSTQAFLQPPQLDSCHLQGINGRSMLPGKPVKTNIEDNTSSF